MKIQSKYGLQAGSVLGQRFKIKRILGLGGMAYVYLATDLKTSRQVAVKVLKEELSHDEEFVRRFDTEARAASSLSHPNIVKVLGVGEEDGMRYMIQEYIEGNTLKDMIDHYGRLDWRVAVPIALQIALALEQAHAAGVVHRDIKPHNIMITPDRVAMVTDFGIARAGTSNTITLAGNNAMGSVHYFSPEQARGGLVNANADIYSLGIVFYEMLIGDVPFDGDTAVAVAIKHLQEQAVPPAQLLNDIPKGLSDIVMKCIQKNPQRRYSNARELIDELDAFILNPQGVYGVLPNVADDIESTQQLAQLNADEKIGKIQILESQISSRKSTKRREIGIVITVIMIGIVLIMAVASKLLGLLNDDTKSSKTPFKVENYVGKNIEEVKAAFSQKNFQNYQIKTVVSAEFESGTIIAQEPKEGTEINPTGLTKLILQVSKGSDALRLTSYIGRDYVEAEKDIQSQNGWKIKVTFENNPDVPANKVIRTVPEAGQIVPGGSTIELIVSKGKKDFVMPDLREQPYLAAAKQLMSMGAGEVVKEVQGAGVSAPDSELYVLECRPDPNVKVQEGSKVILIVTTWADMHPTTTTTTTPTTTTKAPTTTTAAPTTAAPTTAAPTTAATTAASEATTAAPPASNP